MSDKFWLSKNPVQCDICGQSIGDVFYDARIQGMRGTWGCICPKCFKDFGCRVGYGFGQKYELQEDGRYKCTAGSMRGDME